MNLLKCDNGHYYDGDQYVSCPHCSQTKPKDNLSQYTTLNKHYTIYNVIGRGGTSFVYQARDISSNRLVAIKELYPRSVNRNVEDNNIIVNDETQFEISKTHFVREIDKIKTLHNTGGVVELYDTFEENGTLYAVMELLKGTTLHDFNSIGQPFDVLKEIMYCALYNLNNIHKAGVLVLDISDKNMFLTEDGNVLFTDVGSMCEYEKSKELKYTSTINTIFSPPELYSNKDVGTWTDIYSIACVFFYFLNNTYIEDSISRTLNLKKDLNFSHKIDSNIKNAIVHALDVDAKTRTKDVSAFVKELFMLDDEVLPLPNHNYLKKHLEYSGGIEYSCDMDGILLEAAKEIVETDSDKTISLKALGIDENDISKVDIYDIPKEKQAYNMLLNQFKALNKEYDKCIKKTQNLERKLEDRKNATIMMTIGEIVLAFGMTYIVELDPPAIVTVISGIIITIYALYLSFRELGDNIISISWNTGKLLKLSMKIMFIVALASGLILFLPSYIIQKMYMVSFRDKYGFAIGIIFCISLSITCISFIVSIFIKNTGRFKKST